MKHIVIGIRDEDGLTLLVDGKPISPNKSQKLRNHSPDGFNAGYGGSGPAQSALAVLLEVTDQNTALSSYQDFKWKYFARREYLEVPRFEFEFDLEAE